MKNVIKTLPSRPRQHFITSFWLTNYHNLISHTSDVNEMMGLLPHCVFVIMKFLKYIAKNLQFHSISFRFHGIFSATDLFDGTGVMLMRIVSQINHRKTLQGNPGTLEFIYSYTKTSRLKCIFNTQIYNRH